MRTCTNCGAQITCGCQDRTASDGKKVCSNCVAHYEQLLAQPKPKPFNEILQEARTYYNSNPNENPST